MKFLIFQYYDDRRQKAPVNRAISQPSALGPEWAPAPP